VYNIEITNFRNKLECISLASFFQSSLMFVSKAGVHPSGASFQVLSSRVGSGLNHKQQTLD